MKALVSLVVTGFIFVVRSTGAILQPALPSAQDAASGRQDDSRMVSREANGEEQTGTPSAAAGASGNTPGPTATPVPSPSMKTVSTTKPTPTPTAVSTPRPTPTPTPTSTPTPPPSSPYRDGTYSADGSYDTPAGTQNLGVTIQLSGGVIVSSTVTVKATDHTSREYQLDFAANYQPYVNGVKIDTLSLSKVSASSLTPLGFNDAVASIKNQAK